MKDLIKKWWNRTWSNWTLSHYVDVRDEFTGRIAYTKIVYKRTSNDGKVQYRRHRA